MFQLLLLVSFSNFFKNVEINYEHTTESQSLTVLYDKQSSNRYQLCVLKLLKANKGKILLRGKEKIMDHSHYQTGSNKFASEHCLYDLKKNQTICI